MTIADDWQMLIEDLQKVEITPIEVRKVLLFYDLTLETHKVVMDGDPFEEK
ncbi:hypothetical protein V7149_01960 [Bacillus sp. JJ1503]|uniref:hypothetical protein n=1 Tax=Bacillus sp. JJ1503 TaxID=3122956 RepID=UPI002FFE6F31